MDGVLFVAGVENLTLRTTPGRGDVVANAFSITGDNSFLEKLIPSAAWPAFGTIERESLLSGRPVAYTISDLQFSTDAEAHRALEGWLRVITSFLHQIWHIKDHAANLEFGYVVWRGGKGVRVARNFLGMVVTNADCETPTENLNETEFRNARTEFTKFFARLKANVERGAGSRLERAGYFVLGARMSDEAAVKIANYCTALEALFSNDTSELTHKLCERVAWFLGRSHEDRADMFQRVKKAYGIRSRVVHGSADWEKGQPSARETAKFLDGILRDALRAIDSDPALSEIYAGESEAARRAHEAFFLAMVLGKPRT
jgi:hypothetical protein